MSADDMAAQSVVDELCRANMPLVHYEVRALAARLPGHVYTDDLVSAGMAALAMAARSFDPSVGVPFGRYAVRRIRGALLDELRGADWATRSLRAKVRRREAVTEELAATLGRRPTTAEVADAMGLTVQEIEQLDAELHGSVVLRLDVITEDAGADTLLPSSAETPEGVLLSRERQAYLRDAVAALPDRLSAVIRGCFFEERPMREIAVELGVTESRVSQMRSEALRLLKEGLNAHLDPALVSAPENGGGAAARRRAAYYSEIGQRSSFRDRLSAPTEGSDAAAAPRI